MLKRLRKRVFIAVAVFLGLAGIGALGSLGGGSIDPTDPANFNFVHLVNDLGVTVEVFECEAPAGEGPCESWTLAPGEGAVLQEPWGSGDNRIPLRFVSTGAPSCVLLNQPRKLRPGPTVSLSTLPACPTGGS
jgi:hypothetical protein